MFVVVEGPDPRPVCCAAGSLRAPLPCWVALGTNFALFGASGLGADSADDAPMVVVQAILAPVPAVLRDLPPPPERTGAAVVPAGATPGQRLRARERFPVGLTCHACASLDNRPPYPPTHPARDTLTQIHTHTYIPTFTNKSCAPSLLEPV